METPRGEKEQERWPSPGGVEQGSEGKWRGVKLGSRTAKCFLTGR